MIYTPLTKKAMCLAYWAHHGQVDKVGVPYIFHPIHLAETMTDEISCCAALLHDVVEDTDYTLEDLSREFPEEVINILRLLTHEEGQDYFEYVRNIRKDPTAVAIKLADIAHNSDQTRCADTLNQAQLAWFQEKYTKARALLLEE